MSSAGSIMDMIIKIRNNRNLLKKSRYFDKDKNEPYEHSEIPHLKTKATPKQLKEIRRKMTIEKEKSRTTAILVFLVSLVVTYFIFQFFFVKILFRYFLE